MNDKNMQAFRDYLHSVYFVKNSGTANSYLNAIKILDVILHQEDIYNLGNKSLCEINDPLLIEKIIDFVSEEEDKFRNGDESIFDKGKSTQTSYPRGRFCTAAIRKLGEFINQTCAEEASQLMLHAEQDGTELSKTLLKRFHINDKGTEKEIRTKQRVGQNVFRAMLLEIYNFKCCLTGIDIPDVLRASHIVPWAKCEKTRLNPENGLCLSATYDAAFDKHLITFDEKYKLVLSPILKDAYTSDAFRTHFLKFEGKPICLPIIYKPSQDYLEKHRQELLS